MFYKLVIYKNLHVYFKYFYNEFFILNLWHAFIYVLIGRY